MAIERWWSHFSPFRLGRRPVASVPKRSTLGAESDMFPSHREVTEALPILAAQGKITIVGEPLITEKPVADSIVEGAVRRTSIFSLLPIVRIKQVKSI